MIKEIDLGIYEDTKAGEKIILEYGVDSCHGGTYKAESSINHWDNYLVVERTEDKGIVLCWDNGAENDIEKVSVYIARFV